MSRPDPSRRCEMVLLVQAEFDGEIDAAQAAALAAHRAQCPVCQAAGRALAQARELVSEAPYQPMPDAARRRVLARLEAARPAPRPQLWSRLRAWSTAGLSFGLGAACAAALALLILAPGEPNLTRELVADHIRALQPGHLEDVVSTDQHTVKPWFAGKLDYSPPVIDLSPSGYPLIGGRLDVLDHRNVAVIIYQRRKHYINLFIWPADAESLHGRLYSQNGYHVLGWTKSGMNYLAVSELGEEEFRQFVQMIQDLTFDSRPGE